MVDISPSVVSMHVQYDTQIPSADLDARIAEARDAIKHFSDRARREGARRAYAEICSTVEQAATRERPEQIFQFELRDESSWEFLGLAPLP